MLPDADIWRAAMVMVKRYRDDAMQEAAMRADHLLEEGDLGRRSAGEGAGYSRSR